MYDFFSFVARIEQWFSSRLPEVLIYFDSGAVKLELDRVT